MMLESAVLDVKPGRSTEFEAAFGRARAILTAASGCLSSELRRCVENPNRYLLLVRWRSLDDHTRGFRTSPAYEEWRRLLHHFYDPFPTVEHYEALSHRDSSAPVVEFFFSPGSRYSYLAASRVPSLEAETGCRVEWRPVHGPDLRALRGRDPFVGPAVSGQYDWDYRRRDAEAWADYYGIPYREPPSHTFDFKLLAQAAMAAKRLGRAADYGWQLTSTIYGSDVWPVEEAECVEIAERLGMAAAPFAAALHDAENEQKLAEAAAEAHRRGAFGVPTFFLGEEIFWGNDRIAILAHALGKRATT
jgi:2-hydroxychromene-2-carboxylate isomerase